MSACKSYYCTSKCCCTEAATSKQGLSANCVTYNYYVSRSGASLGDWPLPVPNIGKVELGENTGTAGKDNTLLITVIDPAGIDRDAWLAGIGIPATVTITSKNDTSKYEIGIVKLSFPVIPAPGHEPFYHINWTVISSNKTFTQDEEVSFCYTPFVSV